MNLPNQDITHLFILFHKYWWWVSKVNQGGPGSLQTPPKKHPWKIWGMGMVWYIVRTDATLQMYWLWLAISDVKPWKCSGKPMLTHSHLNVRTSMRTISMGSGGHFLRHFPVVWARAWHDSRSQHMATEHNWNCLKPTKPSPKCCGHDVVVHVDNLESQCIVLNSCLNLHFNPFYARHTNDWEMV